jgi:hypothetical protein
MASLAIMQKRFEGVTRKMANTRCARRARRDQHGARFLLRL